MPKGGWVGGPFVPCLKKQLCYNLQVNKLTKRKKKNTKACMKRFWPLMATNLPDYDSKNHNRRHMYQITIGIES